MVTPLTKLFRKNNRSKWTEEQGQAFLRLKKHLTAAPVLACADFGQPFSVETGASDYGLGVALIQNMSH